MTEPTIRGVAEMTLEARSLRTMELFYADALGMRVLQRRDDRVWLAAGDHARLGIWAPGEKEFGDRGGRHVHFALSVSAGTVPELAERLRTHGHRVLGPVTHPGGDCSMYIEDPEGNVVELWDVFERPDGRREGVDLLADHPAEFPGE